jgi:hypothetical protein
MAGGEEDRWDIETAIRLDVSLNGDSDRQASQLRSL